MKCVIAALVIFNMLCIALVGVATETERMCVKSNGAYVIAKNFRQCLPLGDVKTERGRT